MQRGLAGFVRAVALEALNLGATVAAGAEVALAGESSASHTAGVKQALRQARNSSSCCWLLVAGAASCKLQAASCKLQAEWVAKQHFWTVVQSPHTHMMPHPALPWLLLCRPAPSCGLPAAPGQLPLQQPPPCAQRCLVCATLWTRSTPRNAGSTPDPTSREGHNHWPQPQANDQMLTPLCIICVQHCTVMCACTPHL